MSYRTSYYMLLLLVMFYEARTLPAVDTPMVATGVNSIEESDKLPESNLDSVISATIQAGNGTSQVASGATEADIDPSLTGDNEASASNNEPVSIYASGLITPEAFQQYLNQYGGAAGLTPLGAAYPAPMAATPGLYPFPGPIMVQTGYEGFLVPANQAVSSDSPSDVSTTVSLTPAPTSSPGMNPLIAFASRLLPSILMSTLFRIAAVVLSAVGVILFGGAITNALCRLTPICDIPGKAVNYLRSGGAQDVGRMLAEEITPERVRRTTEFVRNAIYKYRQLQKLVDPDSQ